MNWEKILEVMIYLGTVLILWIGLYLAVMTYVWIDEVHDVPESLVPIIGAALVLGLFMGVAAYLYGSFVILPFERKYEGGDQE